MVFKKESVFQKIARERKEKEVKEKSDTNQKAIDAVKEKERMEAIIEPYLDSLKEKLKERDLGVFWVFPDRSGFKKIKNENGKSMQQIFQKDLKKYAGRNIAEFRIGIQDDSRKDAVISFKRDDGIHILVDIYIKPIDKDGKFTKVGWGGRINWRNNDFKTTKVTFKFLERMMTALTETKKNCVGILGLPVTSLIKDMEKLGYKFDDVLSPLAGL